MSQFEWQEIGTVILLQVQPDMLKKGSPIRVYNPSPLRQVEHFWVNHEGVVATIDGEETLDVHHKRHVTSRNRGTNPVSFGLSSHYQKMQARFGALLQYGIGGENIIVETEQVLGEDDVIKGVAFQGSDGRFMQIDHVYAMAPCEPFTRFCLERDDNAPEVMKEALQFLAKGTRGFTGEILNQETHEIRVGDRLLLAR